jgi:Spy/CpxP family protein refolding chaperone
MNAFSRWAAWGSIAGALTLAACGSRPESDAAVAAQAGVTEDPPEVAHAGLIREAISKLTLRPDQQPQVEQLAKEAEARHDAIKQARLALRNALADQVQAGKVDRAALKPQMDALLAAIDQSRPADRAALMRLHDILDKNQRSQFVDAIEARFHGGGHEGHRGGGFHHMQQWAADLNLTDQQRDQIRTALHDKFQGQREQMKEQWRTTREQGHQLLESFRQDQFTLDANSPQIFGRDKIERGIGKMLDLAETAVPLLTPEQRVIAAQKLRTQVGPGF